MGKQTVKGDPGSLIPCLNVRSLSRISVYTALFIQTSKQFRLRRLIIRQKSTVFKIDPVQVTDDILLIQIPYIY